MESVLNFLADNYLYFMIGSGVLLFALIGFAVEGRKKKKELQEPLNSINSMNQMPNQVPNQVVNQNIQSTPEVVQNPIPVNAQVPEMSNDNEVTTFDNAVQSAQTMEPTLENLNSNSQATTESLAFGPISNDENESIFTEPPVSGNSSSTETLNLQAPNTELVMEAPQIEIPQVEVPQMQIPQMEAPQIEIPQVEVPQMQIPQMEAPQMEATEMPVSMQREQPVMQVQPEAPIVTEKPQVAAQNVVEQPVLNNTIQQ